jgi:RecA/RadA recombinase
MGRKPKLIEENEVATESSTGPEEILGDILSERGGEHLNDIEAPNYKISTGSLTLDIATGGGLPPGVHRLVGKDNCGKTPEALEILSNFLKTVPKSRGLFVDAEGKLNDENKGRTDLKYVYKASEWKDGTVFVLVTNEYELVAQITEALLRSEDSETKYGIVIDSNDALILKSDIEKSIDENVKMAGGPLIMKRFLSRNAIHISRKGHICIVISQVSTDIQADKYKQSTNAGNNFTGGNALLHFPTFIIEYNNQLGQSKYILDDPDGRLNDGKTKQVGYNCKVTLRKTTQENKDSVYVYPIKYGRKNSSGIWREREVGAILIAWEYLRRESNKGAFTFEPNFAKELESAGIEFPEKLRSEKAIFEELENNCKLTEYCFKKLKSSLANEELGLKEDKE